MSGHSGERDGMLVERFFTLLQSIRIPHSFATLHTLSARCFQSAAELVPAVLSRSTITVRSPFPAGSQLCAMSLLHEMSVVSPWPESSKKKPTEAAIPVARRLPPS